MTPVFLLSKEGDDGACEEEKGRKMSISCPNWHFLFVDNIIRVRFPSLYLQLARKQLCVSPGKGLKQEKRNYCGERTLIAL